MAKKIIINAAITGSYAMPSINPNVPITPKQIADQAVEAAEAGAAVVHIHVRNPETGEPVNNVDLMEEVYNDIKSRCDAIICPTTGGVLGSSLKDRLAPVARLRPEIASFNCGTMNSCVSRMADKIKNPKYDWEIPYLLSTYNNYAVNTFASMEEYLVTFNEYGTKPECEVYDVGHLNQLAYFIKKGLLKTPVHLSFITGVMGGIPATLEYLQMLLNAARREIGEGNFTWSTNGAGKDQFNMCVGAVIMGADTVRVGLEDNMYLGKGVLAKSNAEQVVKMRKFIDLLDREIATPDEARVALGLK